MTTDHFGRNGPAPGPPPVGKQTMTTSPNQTDLTTAIRRDIVNELIEPGLLLSDAALDEIIGRHIRKQVKTEPTELAIAKSTAIQIQETADAAVRDYWKRCDTQADNRKSMPGVVADHFSELIETLTTQHAAEVADLRKRVKELEAELQAAWEAAK